MYSPWFVFLDPGEAVCVEHCRNRPWEPHKYSNKEEQDSRLSFLLDWVRAYYTREGDMGYRAHLDCFARFDGRKQHVMDSPHLAPA